LDRLTGRKAKATEFAAFWPRRREKECRLANAFHSGGDEFGRLGKHAIVGVIFIIGR